MKFRLFIFLLSATAADECCLAGSTAHHPVCLCRQSSNLTSLSRLNTQAL
jgi:hypothetical protein